MKLYEIPKGTKGKVIVQDPNAAPSIIEWVTRKDLSFTETLLDPVRLHNNRGSYDYNNPVVKLVLSGYAIFGGELGNDHTAKHILAVPYDEVRVS